jgi:iron(III) transport system substrate-binding protein
MRPARSTPPALRLLAVPTMLAMVLAACGGEATESTGGGGDGDTAGTYEDICAAGAEEGALVHWHNHSDGIQEVYAAFNEEHPDIAVEGLEMTPDDAAQRVLTEVTAGREPSVDIVAGQADVFQGLINDDLVNTEIDWTEFDVPEDLVHETNMIRIHRIAMGIGYNTDEYTADDLPDTWEELVDEQWAGEVIVDPRGRPFDQLSLVWGVDEALDYVQRLHDVAQPLVIEGGTAGLVAVAGGEAAMTTGGRSAETLEQQAEGAPVEIKYLDYVPTIDNYNLVLADAPHPNAAQCYAIWFSAHGGQAIYDEAEFKSNETIPTGAPEGAEVVTVETLEQAEQVSEVGREMGRIWTEQ